MTSFPSHQYRLFLCSLCIYIVFFPQLFGLMAHTKKMESTTALQKHSYHPTVNTQNLPTVLLFTLRSSFLQWL